MEDMSGGNQVSFALTVHDLIAAQRLHYRLSPRIWLAGPIIYSVTFLILTLLFRPARYYILAAAGLLYLYPIYYILRHYVMVPLWSRRAHGQQRNVYLEQAYTWTDSGLEWKNEYVTNLILWSDIVGQIDDEASLLLYQSRMKFWLIPKRILRPKQFSSLNRYISRIPLGSVRA